MKGILIAFLLLISSVASATHYYVKNSGSDSNTGLSDAQAWATVSKINSKTFSAGDTISFKCGDTWRETLNVPSSGTSASSITFNSYSTGAHPRILGSTQAITWTETATGSNKWKSSTAFTSNPYSVYTCEIFFENADGTKAWGTYVSGTSGLVAEYNWTWVSNYIYVYSTSDPGSKYTSVEVPQRESAINTNRKNYISFNGIDIFYTYWSGYGYDMSHYDMTEQFGLTIENSEIGYIGAWDEDIEQGYGIESVYSNMTVRNNKIHDCGRRGFAMDIYGSGFTAQNILVELNEFYGGFHTTGCDIDVGAGYTGNLNNVVIRRNYFHEPSKTYNSDLTNLIFIQNNNTSSCTLSNIYIYNNIFKWQNGYGILMEGAQSVYVYNNTFFEKATLCPSWAAFVSVQSSSHATVENNIFYSASSTSGLENATNYVTHNYNLYYNSTISSGTETHGVFSKNPLFSSITDYSLQATSPAIGTATPITVVTTDYIGNTRSATTPSIGAYEYIGTGTDPPVPVYTNSVVENSTPSILEITYSLALTNIVPSTSAFTVKVNSVTRSVNPVSISGTNVYLTMASPVVSGDVVTVAYTKPSANPLQTAAGGQVASITAQPVTNNVGSSNNPPVIVADYKTSSSGGFIAEIDASGSYDLNNDNLTYSWSSSNSVPISSTSTSIIQFLAPVVTSSTTITFVLSLSDGTAVQSLNIPIRILPFKSGLDEATFLHATALSYLTTYFPDNIIDGDVTTQWSGSGDGNWIITRLKTPFKISYIQMAFPTSQPGSSYFDVYASADSLVWDNVLSDVTSCSFSGNYQILEFPSIYTNTEYSYIKIIGHGNSSNTTNNISELKAFGYPHGAASDDNAFQFVVYPNPTIDADKLIASFENPAPDNLKIRVVNQTGEIVDLITIIPGSYNQPISLTVGSGFYILQLLSNNIIVGVQKLIVVR